MVHPLQVWVSRLCDSLSFRVCVTSLVFRLGDKFSFRVCVTNLAPASVCQLWFPFRATSLCDKFSFSRLCHKFSFTVSVTSLVFASVYKFCSLLCVTNLVFSSVSDLVLSSV